MNFIEAINLLDTDTVKSVRKSSWERGKYIFIDNDVSWRLTVTLDKPNCMTLPYSASIDDILDRDWEIYKEEPKLLTFEEAFKAYKLGKYIYSISLEESKRSRYYGFSIHDKYKKEKEKVLIEARFKNDWIIEERDQND